MLKWFRSLRGKKREASVVAEDGTTGVRKYKLLENVEIQTRRAQNLDPDFAAAIRKVCEELPSIRQCFILDMRRQDMPTQMFLLLEVVVKKPVTMDQVAAQFATSLEQFPDWPRTFILAARPDTLATMVSAAFFQRV